jgi:hypothetical protein
MTQTFKRVEERPTSREVLEDTICDMCGKTAPRDTIGPFPGWQYNGGTCRESDQIISYCGFTYAEMATKIDLCPTCYRNKLVPWLISQGVNVQKRTRNQGGLGMEGGW